MKSENQKISLYKLLVFGVCPSLISATVFLYFWNTYVLDTKYFEDTLFLAKMGWRAYNGAIPVHDYGTFYGGANAYFTKIAFHLFGTNIKSLEYAQLIQFFLIFTILIIFSFNRISVKSFIIILLLITACILTRAPLESRTIQPAFESSHAFTYNRFALSLSIIGILFIIVKSKSILLEYICSFILGIILYAICLVKPTFIIFPLFGLISLFVLKRHIQIAFIVVGICFSIFIIDPKAEILIGSMLYGLAVDRPEVTVFGLIGKSFRLIFADLVALILLLATFAFYRETKSINFYRVCSAILILICGVVGIAATMGGPNFVGFQILPALVVIQILLSETLPMNKYGWRNQYIGFALAVGFSAPFIVNSLIMSFLSDTYAFRSKIYEGPMTNYVVVDSSFRDDEGHPVFLGAWSFEQEVAFAKRDLRSGMGIGPGIEYLVLVDGIRELNKVQEVSNLGIVTNSPRFDFSYPLEAKPTLSFPSWPSPGSPELQSLDRLDNEVDMVMILSLLDREEMGERIMGDKLMEIMKDDFIFCRKSAFWLIFIRVDEKNINCH